MQVGCGFRVKDVKGRDYVYFWRYEIRGGRSRQIYRYMGPKGSEGTARRLSDALERTMHRPWKASGGNWVGSGRPLPSSARDTEGDTFNKARVRKPPIRAQRFG